MFVVLCCVVLVCVVRCCVVLWQCVLCGVVFVVLYLGVVGAVANRVCATAKWHCIDRGHAGSKALICPGGAQIGR